MLCPMSDDGYKHGRKLTNFYILILKTDFSITVDNLKARHIALNMLGMFMT